MKLIRVTSMALVIIMLSFKAYAVPILEGTNDAATGITGLEIDGKIFDIDFRPSGESYNDIFQDTDPYFLNNEEGAKKAVSAIVNFLHDSGVTGVTDVQQADNLHKYVYIPWNLWSLNTLVTNHYAFNDNNNDLWFGSALMPDTLRNV